MKRTIGIVVLLVCAWVMRAQTITSYSCDFETASENAQWRLNECATNRDISQCMNKWYIGAAGGFGVGSAAIPSAGLYISSGAGNDTLVSSYSNAQSVFVTASRELQFAQGTYSVVFDWEAMGSSNTDGLYVFWVENATTRTFSNWSDRTSLNLPSYVTNTTRYGGAAAWRSSAFTFSTAGNGGKLVVLWLNSLGPVQEPAGKLDNILVYDGSLCAPPTNVRYNGNTASITWQGNASSYDVMLYNYQTKKLDTYPGITSTSMQMPNINEEGYYYIYVRSVCGDGHSTWAYTEKFIWIKGARCIDLFDLTPDNSGAAKCYSGSTEDLMLHSGQVDYGYQDEQSLHTIHYVQGERDPRTGNQLKTIPDGEIASIRLGGLWLSDGNKSSTVEYQYPVQAGVSDLLELKYATILEYADYHSESEEARFKLEVLSNGVPVNSCAQGDFKAGFGETSTWHRYTYNNPAGGTRDIYWNNWQTITVSLRDYIGQTLTIRLTAYSCTATIHIGYAYFTLNCKGGDLQGIACGDFSTDHFEAPEGFRYRWYLANDPSRTVLSTNRSFHIDRDDPSVYVVDVIDPNKPQCYYSLEANPNPRFPQAKGKMLSSHGANCKNVVDFSQQCSVVRINRLTLDSILTDEPVENIVWDFGDGSTPVMSMSTAVTHEYPAEGGEYDVKISAEMSGGICADTCTLHISLPDITSPDEHTYSHYCEEGVDRTDTTYVTTSVGCEQRKMHHHMYHSTYDTLYTDRMCEGGRYLFPGDGKYYTQSVDTTLYLKSVYDCDSIIRLNLIVDPKLDVLYPAQLKVCYDDQVVSGSMDSIRVFFSEHAQQYGFEPVYEFANGEEILIPLPQDARPDKYDVQLYFGGERCQMDIQNMPMMLTYPASIVMQTGGFIAVQNANYNGGYEFMSFAWYRNGDKIENANASYIPASEQDFGATYVVELTRMGDNYSVESCPILYNPYAQGIDNTLAGEMMVWPTSVAGGGALMLAPEACTIYSVLGGIVARHEQASAVRTVNAPAQAGVYVVVFDNHQSTRIIVR